MKEMNTRLIISIQVFILLCASGAYAQETIQVNLFRTVEDFKKGLPSDSSAVAKVRRIEEDYVIIPKFFDSLTGKKLKGVNRAWALEWNGDLYFHMLYAVEYANPGVFLKFDKIGSKYCMIFIDDNSPNLIKNGGPFYGGGLTGGAISASQKGFGKWTRKNGLRSQIVIASMEWNEDSEEALSQYKAGKAHILYPRDFRRAFGLDDQSISEIKEMTFEEVLDIIDAANHK